MRRSILLAILIAMGFSLAACAGAAANEAKQPEIKLEAALSSTGPIFGYIVGKPYTLSLTATNLASDEIKLDHFSVSWTSDKKLTIDVKPDPNAPDVLLPSKNVVANFTLKFPAEAGGRQVTLIGKLDYTLGKEKRSADCRIFVQVTPEYEITILPARMVLDAKKGAGRIGMSVINHTDSEFKGKITLTTSPGISIDPASVDAQIDSQGLEAKVYTVTREPKAAPGHYAVFVDVGGKQNDWAAVDVPVMAKKTQGPVSKLIDSKDAASVDIAKASLGADGKWTYQNIGQGWFAYDDNCFYAAFQIDNKGAGSALTMAFDPLMNGAQTNSGGYKDDDLEIASRSEKSASALPIGHTETGHMSFYYVTVPWSKLAGFKPKQGATFAAAAMFKVDGATVEWGGGIADKDPRKFVPIMLTQ